MNILRLSTLSLGLAIAVFAVGYNPSFADKPKCGSNQNQHCDHGDDPGGDPSVIKYTAELLGAFVFPPRTVVLESQDLVLRSSEPVTIVRPPDTEFLAQNTWDNVFDFCDLLTEMNNVRVNDFTALAGKKGWTIERPGGVGVRFRNIGSFESNLGELDLRMDLIGDCAYSGGTDETCDPFPPAEGETSRIPLTDYLIHARGQPGINSVCHGERAPFDFGQESTLVITALCSDGSIPPCPD